jgi:ferredoxin
MRNALICSVGATAALTIGSMNPIAKAQDPCPTDCPHDIGPFGGDGVVDRHDLRVVEEQWGPCPPDTSDCNPCEGDVDGNGVVNVDDLLAVNNAYGACPAGSISWSYSIDPPAQPASFGSTVTFGPGGQTSYTIADIQAAIASNKKIIVNGSPTGGTVNTILTVSGKTNLELDFTGADVLTWTGSAQTYTWFVNVYGASVQIKIKGLRFNGANGKIGGVNMSGNNTDVTLENVVFDSTCLGLDIQNTQRLQITGSEFKNTVVAQSAGWVGSGYAGYMAAVQDVWLDACLFDSHDPSGVSPNDYPLRVGVPTDFRASSCIFDAGGQNTSFRTYGANNVELWNCEFRNQRVWVGIACGNDPQSGTGTTGVRISDCDFINVQVEQAVASLFIMCSYVVRDVKLRNLRFTNCEPTDEIEISWPDDVPATACSAPYTGSATGDINWWPDQICVTGPSAPLSFRFASEWTPAEMIAQDIQACPE